jgi:hypothetical protein
VFKFEKNVPNSTKIRHWHKAVDFGWFEAILGKIIHEKAAVPNTFPT